MDELYSWTENYFVGDDIIVAHNIENYVNKKDHDNNVNHDNIVSLDSSICCVMNITG